MERLFHLCLICLFLVGCGYSPEEIEQQMEMGDEPAYYSDEPQQSETQEKPEQVLGPNANGDLHIQITDLISVPPTFRTTVYSNKNESGGRYSFVVQFAQNKLILRVIPDDLGMEFFREFVYTREWVRELRIDGYTLATTVSSEESSRSLSIEMDNNDEIQSVKLGDLHLGGTPAKPPRSTTTYHTVVYGENVKRIAAKYDLSLQEILSLNPDVEARGGNYPIYPGERLKIKD